MSKSAQSLSRIGTACYVVWGLLHFQAAYGVLALARTLEPTMVVASAVVVEFR